MTQFQSKLKSANGFKLKAALLSASVLCASACATPYAGATNADLAESVPANSPTVDAWALDTWNDAPSAQTVSPQTLTPITLGLLSAQTSGLSPETGQSVKMAEIAPSVKTSAITIEPTKEPLAKTANLATQITTEIKTEATSQTTTPFYTKTAEAPKPGTQMSEAQMTDGKMSNAKASGQMEKTDMKSDKKMMDSAAQTQSPQSQSPQTQSPMNTLLGQYVKAPDAMGIARFDYAGLKASQSDQKVLADYIQSLEAKDPNTLSAPEATAYWANLYNAVTLKVVVDNYPVKSIKEIRSGAFSAGPWKKKLTTVNGNPMTLDEIEHETLRKKYPSPLIHYMVNCASIGCPNLKSSLWNASTLDADRKEAARTFINSARGAKVTSKGLVVSSIYDWFQEDFGGSKAGVVEHLSQYATGDLKSAIDGRAKIKSFDYDWTLNE